MGFSLVITINRVKTEAVIDTAAQVTLVNERLLRKLKLPLEEDKTVILREVGEDSMIPAKKACKVLLKIGSREYRWDVYVAPITDKCLLRLDFFKAFHGNLILQMTSLP